MNAMVWARGNKTDYDDGMLVQHISIR
ncbi:MULTISPECIES: hypothetical protein [unclassified Mucilaginibacter]